MPKTKKKKKLDRASLEKIAKVFSAFADPTRLAILQELIGQEQSVGALVEQIGVSQGNMSKQLQLLFDAGLLQRNKQGNQVFYSIRDDMVMPMCELVCDRLNRDVQGAASLSFQI